MAETFVSQIEGDILVELKKLYGEEVKPAWSVLQETRKEFEGDFTLVVFPFVKLARKKPEDVAQEIGKAIEKTGWISSFEVVKGFLNLTIHPDKWVGFMDGWSSVENLLPKASSKHLVMVEYSSPNTNKPLHLGHIRNNLLGYSVSEILKAHGHEVVKTQIINDRGIHICKSMVAWEKFGEGITPEKAGVKGDKLVGQYYVRFDQELSKEVKKVITDLIKKNEAVSDEGKISIGHESVLSKESAGKVASWINKYLNHKELGWDKSDATENKELIELLKPATSLMQEAQEMLKRWEDGDEQVMDLWKRMNGWVYDGFEATYDRMGVDFDKLYYESDTYLVGKKHVLEGVKKGLFEKREDGSVWADLTSKGLDEKLLLRSDGTSVYMTQDIGTAALRVDDYPRLKQLIYTVGNEQDYHFKVLFILLEMLGYEWANNCYHLSYGMVDLPSGKMKSREGTVVDADDLMEEMVAEAERVSDELGKLDASSDEERKAIYEQVGLAALKYYILKVDPKKRMMFNPEESIDFNGNTGPFVQYAHARIQAILRRAENLEIEPMARVANIEPKERDLVRKLSLFAGVIADAAAEKSPAVIANYAYDVVKAYNAFYQTLSIFNEENRDVIAWRVLLSDRTGQVIAKCLNLLGIAAPERM